MSDPKDVFPDLLHEQETVRLYLSLEGKATTEEWLGAVTSFPAVNIRRARHVSSPMRTPNPQQGAVPVVATPQRRISVVVRSPLGAPDAGPVALVQIAAALREELGAWGVSVVTDPKTAWVDKLRVVEEHLTLFRDAVSLILVGPIRRRPGDSMHPRAQERASEVVRLICRAGCPLTVLDAPSGERVPEGIHFPPGTSWAPPTFVRRTLAPLRGRAGGPAGTEATGVWDSLALSLERSEPLRRFLAPLSYVRGSFGSPLLRHLGLERMETSIVETARACLAAADKDLYEFDSTAARVVRRSLGDEERREAHRALARYYAGPERPSLQPDRVRPAYPWLDEMEAFHHASIACDPTWWERFGFFFVDQLDALGRELIEQARSYPTAARVFERALALDPDDAYAHHGLARAIDAQGLEAERVAAHYAEAIRLEPGMFSWRADRICFHIAEGSVQEALRLWEEARDLFQGDETSDDVGAYERAHGRLAALLIHRQRLKFAREVLADVPEWAWKRSPTLVALSRRLGAFLEVERGRALVPAPHLEEGWWRNGPFLLSGERANGARLLRWLAARVEGVVNDRVVLLVIVVGVDTADRQGQLAGPPEPATMAVSVADLQSWLGSGAESIPKDGEFLEIGVYATHDGTESMHAIPHALRTWREPDLPAIDLDPERYLRTRFESR